MLCDKIDQVQKILVQRMNMTYSVLQGLAIIEKKSLSVLLLKHARKIGLEHAIQHILAS